MPKKRKSKAADVDASQEMPKVRGDDDETLDDDEGADAWMTTKALMTTRLTVVLMMTLGMAPTLSSMISRKMSRRMMPSRWTPPRWQMTRCGCISKRSVKCRCWIPTGRRG